MMPMNKDNIKDNWDDSSDSENEENAENAENAENEKDHHQQEDSETIPIENENENENEDWEEYHGQRGCELCGKANEERIILSQSQKVICFNDCTTMMNGGDDNPEDDEDDDEFDDELDNYDKKLGRYVSL